MARTARHRTLLLVVLALVGLVLPPTHLAAATPASVETASVDAWTTSSYANVFQDAVKPPGADPSYRLVVARNEYESFQVLTRSAEPFTITGVTVPTLTSGANTIPAANIVYNFVEYKYLSGNSSQQTASEVVRTGAGWYPDPLSNQTTIGVAANSTQPIWVTVYTPKNTVAGVYTGNLVVNAGAAGSYTVPLSVEVNAVTLPDPNSVDAGFKYMHHQQIVGRWFDDATVSNHSIDEIFQQYGYDRYTTAWWNVVRDMAKRMKAHRQNVLFVNSQQLLLDSGTTVDANGTYDFKWGRFDEYIEFFINEGVVRGLEGVHVGSIQYPSPDPSTWYYKTYILQMVNGEMGSTNVTYNSTAATDWINQYLPALKAHLESRGWLAMWHQHLGDEASNLTAQNQYSWYLTKANALVPAMRVGDPVLDYAGAERAANGGADVVIPIEHVYQSNPSYFEGLRASGKEIWVYNCESPATGYLNRFIDKPVWQQRSLGWVLYKWGVDGYLHWGWNLWERKPPSDPEVLYKGDFATVYPDPGQNSVTIKGSIRWEANRDAAEDWELLNLASKKSPKLVQNMIGAIAESASSFTTNIDDMIARRIDLVRMAAGANVFSNPIGNEVNPFVTRAGGQYRLAASIGNRIYIKSASRLQDVSAAAPEYVWSAASAGMSLGQNAWVSSLQYLSGRWYLYFTADQRMYVLEGGTNASDPLQGGFVYKGQLRDPNADWWATDGVVQVINGTPYYVWSALPSGAATTTYTYIATMSDPWTLSSQRIEISRPDQAWEGSTNAAPQFVARDGTFSLVYSAGDAGSDSYALGRLTLASGANPLAKTSWTKAAGPVFKSDGQTFGPGKASFTTSPDGTETWMLYHARKYQGSGWERNTRVQRVGFDASDNPVFGSPLRAGAAMVEPAGSTHSEGVYEAEDATLVGKASVGTESNASRKKVVYGINLDGDGVKFSFTVPAAGAYWLNVRAAAGYAGSTHQVVVNTDDARTLEYPFRGWNNFNTVAMRVNLKVGDNDIYIMKGAQHAEVDWISITDRMEGEDAVLGGDTLRWPESDTSGGEAAAGINSAGSSVEFWTNVPAGGTYVLDVANSTGYTGASHQLWVNGTQAKDLFYANDGWNDFVTKASNLVTLTAGTNKIKLVKGANYAEVDYITLRPLGSKYEAEAGTQGGIASVGTESEASGGQVVWQIDTTDSYSQLNVTVPTAGAYTVNVRAASGSAYPGPDHLVYVNPSGPTPQLLVPLPYRSIDWNRFAVTSFRVRLNAGSNVLRFAKGNEYAEIDYVEIQ
ncbi:glycoside hydrolase domain-containing protein [Kribbella sp. NPDC003505]|uniref:glycoside hydrolase domain-containing protein n=1 Tax=Kribbella sp. NPDC003505 TaxID=3154448 RepID=UPI0033B3C0FC